MGLKDKMKKKRTDEDSDDEIGDFTDQEGFALAGENEEAEDDEVPESTDEETEDDDDEEDEDVTPEAEAEPEVSAEVPKEDGGVLSSLDLFSQETVEEEGNLLAKQLPELDINDVLEECREVLRLLNEGLKQE